MSSPDQDRQAPTRFNQSSSARKDYVKAFDSPERDDVCLASWQSLRATREDLDIGQGQAPDYLSQEGRFFPVRLDQCKVNVGSPYLDRQTREPGAGTYVKDARPGQGLRGDEAERMWAYRLSETGAGQQKSDSPKWRVTISSGLRTAVRLMRAFQRSSISMYIDIDRNCAGDMPSSIIPQEGCEQLCDTGFIHRLQIVVGGDEI